MLPHAGCVLQPFWTILLMHLLLKINWWASYIYLSPGSLRTWNISSGVLQVQNEGLLWVTPQTTLGVGEGDSEKKITTRSRGPQLRLPRWPAVQPSWPVPNWDCPRSATPRLSSMPGQLCTAAAREKPSSERCMDADWAKLRGELGKSLLLYSSS